MSDGKPDPVDLGWKRHAAINDWTSKIDSKASIVLTLESAVCAAIVALSAEDRPLGSLEGTTLWTYRLGVLLLVVGLAAATLVVRPRLKSRAARAKYPTNTIYFGHLRYWSTSELADHLDSISAKYETEMLALQLTTMAGVAWTKHRLLQLSLTIFPFGVLFIGSVLASQ